MAGKKRKKVREKDVEGIKYFDKLMPLLERLHEVGCERDSAGNRRLHMDQYCSLVLLFLFNPICGSLRGIQQASELKKVQRKLGCPRAALGSLSESVGVFEPERLKEIIGELGEQLAPIAKGSRLKDVERTITLVDGSLLKVLPWLSQRMLQKPTDEHKIRLHAHFEVDRHVPTSIKVTGGTARGEDHERAVMLKSIDRDRVYVMDRGYEMFKLFNDIVAADSSYVCRVRDNSSPEVIEQRPLCDEDIEADVLDDVIGRFGKTSKQDARPNHLMRMVTIKTTPHVKRGKYKGGSTGPGSDGVLRIVTDMLDLPAWVIGLIYRYRWTIEVFFRFFKHILGCRHLLSTKPEGIEIQTYMAIIACMLISLWTGCKPTLRTYEMICYYFIGWAEEEELLAHIAKLKPHAS